MPRVKIGRSGGRSVAEDAKAGVVIAQGITATDDDTGNNAKLAYKIVKGNSGSAFELSCAAERTVRHCQLCGHHLHKTP